MIVSLTKLQHLKNPVHGPERSAFVYSNDIITGEGRADPTIGEQYWLYGITYRAKGIPERLPWFHTSRIKSIYKHGSSDKDKLVLPDSFPDRESIVFPELIDGDCLLATENSVYHMRIIE